MTTRNVRNEIERLERSFWQSMVDGHPDVATRMLHEPALMVSSHGANKFDHAGYMKMAKDDTYALLEYELSDMDVVNPSDDVAIATYRVHQVMKSKDKRVESDAADSSTWVKVGGQWRCVIHTESLIEPRKDN